ncbi:MAG: hypothetical protein HFJ49_02990 [Clostridia bacterium]|nr:hypothetical protein [Clostridia bacterium]
MQRLIERYKVECSINSKAASILWKIGIIILSIVYIKLSYESQNYFKMFIMFLIGILILYLLCLFIFKRKAFNKIYSGKVNKNNCKKLKILYLEIDKYQKNWMTNYCKTNNIDKISKLEILRSSLCEERKLKAISYINPIIIGSLTFTIWEIGLQKLSDEIGHINMIFIAIVVAIILSVIIGIMKKEFIENKEMFLEFDKFASNKRLEDLLLYEILKCKK